MILICSAVTILLAVANRVLYELAFVPFKQYPFFLAQFSTFGYVGVYFSILYFRYRAGIVTDEMLALPKSRFAAIGLLEALGVAAGMASAAMLPGPTIPILNQGKSVDIFVVNSFGSGNQAIFVLLFLPFLSNLKGIPFAELPAYMRSGVAYFLNRGSIQGCDGASVLPMLYVPTNMAFNISLLNLVKISSAVIASLAMTLSVPISIYILS